jgi:hypothetical protein
VVRRDVQARATGHGFLVAVDLPEDSRVDYRLKSLPA